MRTQSTLLKDRYPLFDDETYENKSYYDQLVKRQAEIQQTGESICPGISRYFGNRLPDSWVISANQIGNHFELCMNEFSSHVFCDALAKLTGKKILEKKRRCPVTFIFENIRSCSLYRVNNNQKLIPVNKDKFLPRLSEYANNQVHEFNQDRIWIGIGFYTLLKNRDYLILEIDAEKLTINEGQRQAVLQMFGEKYINLFDAYWQELETTAHDYSSAMHFLKDKL